VIPNDLLTAARAAVLELTTVGVGLEAEKHEGVAFMPVPRCSSCRWWQPHPCGSGLGDCALFECRGMEQQESGTKLIVTRTESGEATIVTHDDFGCVQWEAHL